MPGGLEDKVTEEKEEDEIPDFDRSALVLLPFLRCVGTSVVYIFFLMQDIV